MTSDEPQGEYSYISYFRRYKLQRFSKAGSMEENFWFETRVSSGTYFLPKSESDYSTVIVFGSLYDGTTCTSVMEICDVIKRS